MRQISCILMSDRFHGHVAMEHRFQRYAVWLESIAEKYGWNVWLECMVGSFDDDLLEIETPYLTYTDKSRDSEVRHVASLHNHC